MLTRFTMILTVNSNRLKIRVLVIVWFQKISRPPPWRELEIPVGWRGQRPRKFQKGGGLDHKITFQGVNIILFST